MAAPLKEGGEEERCGALRGVGRKSVDWEGQSASLSLARAGQVHCTPKIA